MNNLSSEAFELPTLETLIRKKGDQARKRATRSHLSRPAMFQAVDGTPSADTASPLRPRAGPERSLLRLGEVMKRTGCSRSLIYKLAAEGLFPSPRKICGANISVWDSLELASWLDAQVATENTDVAPKATSTGAGNGGAK